MAKNIFTTKLVNLNFKIYPFLTIFTYSTLLVESFTYSGFIGNFIFLSAKSFLLISLFSGILLWIYKSRLLKNEKISYISLHKLVRSFNYLSAPVLVFVYYIIVVTEAANYPNYIFSTYHLLPENFIYILIFNLFNIFIGLSEGYKKPRYNSKNFIYPNRIKQGTLLVIVVLLLYYSIDNLAKTSIAIIKESTFIFRQPFATYDEKMEEKWNLFYKYMKFVKEYTPDNSSIAIPPPIRPWLSEGNSVLVRYFLYPRFLITIENEFQTDKKPDYFMLTKGLWKAYDEKDYGWPKENINAEKIIYFEESSGEVKEIYTDYDPSDPKNINAWGLIKVKY